MKSILPLASVRKKDSDSILPKSWRYGTLFVLIGIAICVVAFSIWIDKQLLLWLLLGIGAILLCIIGLFYQISGYINFQRNDPNRSDHIRVARREAVGPEEIFEEHAIVPNVCLQIKSIHGVVEHVFQVGDLVFGKRSLCFLFRFALPEKMPKLFTYPLFGLVGAPLYDALKNLEAGRKYRAELESADRKRQESIGKPLAKLMGGSSFSIPADSIIRIEMSDNGMLTILEGPGTFRFTVGEVGLEPFESWLKVARSGRPLPCFDPKLVQPYELNRILKLPIAQIKAEYDELLIILNQSKTFMLTVANVVDLETCRLIRKIEDAPEGLLNLRRAALPSLLSKNVFYASVGLWVAAFGAFWLVLMMLGHGSWDAINKRGKDFEAFILFGLITIGEMVSIGALVKSWGASRERAKPHGKELVT